MQWFELEGETASGGNFRTTRTGASMVDAIKAFERSHPGWIVQGVIALTPALEQARKVTKAALDDNQYKADMMGLPTARVNYASPCLICGQSVIQYGDITRGFNDLKVE